MPRTATIRRETTETKIDLALDLDGTGQHELATGVGFFNHMLNHLARHGLFDLKVKDSYNCDVLSLTAATAAIQDQEYLAQTRRNLLATRERLTESLRGLGFDVTPSQANFVWARRADRPVKPLYEGLKARKVLVRYMNYPGYGDGLRVSVGTDAEIDRLLKELTALLTG